jgi:hypothetical protein
MAITPLPPAPQVTDDTATFNTKAFAWVDSIDDFTTEANALAVQANTDAGTATTQAGIATTQAGIATTKAGEASDDADAAAASALEAAGLVENYQGALASDPALNKDGGALAAGDWYVNTVSGLIRAYDGAEWVTSVNVTAGVESINGLTGVVTGFVTETGTQTLSNKTLTGSKVTVSALGTLTTGTETIDLATAQVYTATITASDTITIAFSNAPSSGQSQVVLLRLTDAGGGTIVWPADTKFTAGTAPTLTASGVDVLGVYYDVTTTTYMVFVIGLDVKVPE